MLLEAEPPRMCRAMAEFFLPRIPWYSEMIHRVGAVVGTPENCAQLLEREEAIMVFPEGHRGFIKPYSKAYQLQRFGTGFVRLALQTNTPIVPVGIVGSEEQSPGLTDARWLGRLIGAPAFPITVGFPLFGLLGYLPLPVKYRIRFGEPILFSGDAQEEDAAIQEKVDTVKDQIALLLEEGLAERSNWFM
jgi:1-acyl-sn-glycerol-3-phosphate acyltransferase